MLPYTTLIHLDRKATTPIFLQLTNQLVQLIQNGQLAPGTKLPSSRKFAQLFQLNRNTVTKSIEELEALGWVDILPKRGAFVVTTFPEMRPTAWLTKEEKPTTRSFDFYDFPYLKRPKAVTPILGFDDGLPDVRLAPVDELARAYARNIRQLAFEKDLNYNDGLGNLLLRKELAKMLQETKGMNVTHEHILITRGTVMAIHLAVGATIRPNDGVIVGETNYKTANMVIQHFGGQLWTVPVDEQGLQVEKIPAICEKQSIRAIYVTSHHHHPTTVTLAPQRRLELLKMAKQYNFVILEDDYDYDFHYGNSPILPLASGNNRERMLYFGSFTKAIAPAFRVGYLVGSKRLMQIIPKLRRILDRQGDTVLEKTIADLLADGTIRRHLKKAWRHYKDRRDFCCDLLKKELGELIVFEKPSGGMAIWATFSKKIEIERLSKNMKRRGIYLSDGQTYNPVNQQLNGVRMGFASMDFKEMEEAVKVLREEVERLAGGKVDR